MSVSVNMESLLWNITAFLVQLCSCPGRQVVWIKPWKKAVAACYALKEKSKKCTLCRCAFEKKEDIEKYNKICHAESPRPHFACLVCAKGYTESKWLNGHFQEKLRQGILYGICGETQKAHNFQRHRERHLLPDGTYYHGTVCPKCHWRSNDSRTFKRHVNLCYKTNWKQGRTGRSR